MDIEILEQTENYYSEKIKTFGATSKGVDWNSEESQKIRFDQLSKVLQYEKEQRISICDYGCGYGFYLEYLEEKGCPYYYTGIDVSKDMIACANQKYGFKENTKFIHGSEIDKEYDYIIASGIFNVRQKISDTIWTEYIIETLKKFQRYSKRGFAFNILTKYSDLEYKKDYLYYADPLFYFDYAKQHFSRNICLLHDYDLYEFTILVRK